MLRERSKHVGEDATYTELARVFLRISLLGFGGPNAHIALMLDEVVERRGWLTRQRFLEIVAVTNLLPGPNSSETAIHIGYTQRGWRGALLAGLCFAGPTFVLVVTLSALYFRFGRLPQVAGLFRGLQPFIVATVLGAGWKLARAAVTGARLVTHALLGLGTTLLLGGWEVFAMAAGGFIAWALHREGPWTSPRTSVSVLLLLPAVVGSSELVRLFWLMLATGSVLFGGGYMLIALIEPHVVERLGWLTQQQFLDGIALTQAVPGPIVSLVAFVGYAVAGVAGAGVAMLGIYIPSFAAVLLAAPRLERWRGNESVAAALSGVNAVAAGAIVGVALTLVPTAVPDVIAAALLALALVAAFVFRVGAAWLVGAGVLAGVLRLVLDV